MNNTSFLSSSDVGEADLELIKISSESPPQRLMTEVISWININKSRRIRRMEKLAKAKNWRIEVAADKEVILYSCLLTVLAGQVEGNQFHANIKVPHPWSTRNGFSLLLILLGVRNALRSALTELCVASDVLAIASKECGKDKRYMLIVESCWVMLSHVESRWVTLSHVECWVMMLLGTWR